MTSPSITNLSAVSLATCSYRELKPEMGVPIGTSVGKNKRHPDAIQADKLKPWSTFRKSAGLTVPQQEARYHKQLDGDRAHIESTLLYIANTHPGETLVFLCYEVLSAKSYCHRRWLASWLTREFGVSVPELGRHVHPTPAAVSEETLL